MDRNHTSPGQAAERKGDGHDSRSILISEAETQEACAHWGVIVFFHEMNRYIYILKGL